MHFCINRRSTLTEILTTNFLRQPLVQYAVRSFLIITSAAWVSTWMFFDLNFMVASAAAITAMTTWWMSSITTAAASMSTTSISTTAASMATAAASSWWVTMMNMFGWVNWVFVNWDSVNFLLYDDWIRNLDRNFHWIRNFDFFDDWNLYNFIFWNLLVVMLVDCVDWNFYTSDVMFMTAIKILNDVNEILKFLSLLTVHHHHHHPLELGWHLLQQRCMPMQPTIMKIIF